MKYNESYYLMFPYYANGENLKVIPTEETGLTRFHYKRLKHGKDHLRFLSKAKAADILNGSDVLFCGPTLLVSKSIKDVLENRIYKGQLFPALVETSDNKHHEFFVVNIFDELDCWDRARSIFELDEDDDDDARVYNYSLDSCALGEIEASGSLLFKMGGTDLSPLFVHQNLKEQLSLVTSNVNFFPVLEYQFGDEYK
ncbi:hypothetical protein KZY41_004347 [Vibrio vulnificus]|nr:hypothetical protein [Vibrio vulnificus]